MKKFLVLYMGPTESFEAYKSMSDEERQKEMKVWSEWFEANKNHFADEGTAAGANTRITKDGVEDVANGVGGYGVVQAASKEEAIQIMQTNPHFEMPGGYIEVMEWLDM